MSRRRKISATLLPRRGKNTGTVRYLKLSSRVGRFPKINEKLIKECVELLLEGLPVNRTCDYMGINEQTYYNWKTRGEEYLRAVCEGKKPKSKSDEIYGLFVQAVVRAKATWQLEILRRSMQTDSPKSSLWIRDMTLLERRDRGNWSRNETLHVDDSTILPDEAYL